MGGSSVRTRRWGKAAVAVAALGALLTFSATGVATGTSEGDTSCKPAEQSSKSVRKAKTITPRPPAACPEITVTKSAEKDSYKQGESIKWTVTIKNTGDSAVKLSVEDEGVKLAGPGAKGETARKASKTKTSSCEGEKKSSSKKTSKSSSKKKDCDTRVKCGGLLEAGATLVCTGYQKAEKCGTVKNTVKVTASGVKAKDDKEDDKDKDKDKKKYGDKSKSSDSSGKVVVKASDETFVVCDPSVKKDAKASYTRTWDWSIIKTASTNNISSTNATETVTYTVKVKKTLLSTTNIKVTGEIDVYNPYPFDVGVEVKDTLDASCLVDGEAVKTDTIGHGKKSYSYVCTPGTPPLDGAMNTASVTFDVKGVKSTLTATSPISTHVTEVNDTVNVTDVMRKVGSEAIFAQRDFGTTNKDETFTYTQEFTVPATNCESYKNIATVSAVGSPQVYPPKGDHEGTTTGGETNSEYSDKTTSEDTTSNQASEAGGSNYGTTTNTGSTASDTTYSDKTETTGSTTKGDYPNSTPTMTPKSDEEIVEICRAVLTISKDAALSYTNTWTWGITKSATVASVNSTNAAVNYSVTATKSSTPVVSNAKVTGTITITNPYPAGAVSGVVTDTLSDGTVCTVTGGSGAGGAPTAIASGVSTFPYVCDLGATVPAETVKNVGKVNFTANNVAGEATAQASITAGTVTLVNDSVTVTDVLGADSRSLGTITGTTTFPQYSRTVATPAVDTPCVIYTNTATVNAVPPSSASASVEVCGGTTTPPTPPSATVVGNPPVLGQAAGISGGPVSNRAALALSKTGPSAATAGQLVTYRIKVTNRSKIAARNVVLRDLLPSGFSVSGKIKGASISKGRISWKVGTLAAGKSKTVSVKLRIDRSVGGRRCNSAVATAGNANTVRDAQCTRIAAVAGALQPAVTG
jgi:uncharacterized repeat protein (TIGR01451 family)